MSDPQTTPPKPTADPPETKIVKFKKLPGGRWEVTFKGPVRQGDVNHLVRAMRVEFNRAKRKLRVQLHKETRLIQEKAQLAKETPNAVREPVAA